MRMCRSVRRTSIDLGLDIDRSVPTLRSCIIALGTGGCREEYILLKKKIKIIDCSDTLIAVAKFFIPTNLRHLAFLLLVHDPRIGSGVFMAAYTQARSIKLGTVYSSKLSEGRAGGNRSNGLRKHRL